MEREQEIENELEKGYLYLLLGALLLLLLTLPLNFNLLFSFGLLFFGYLLVLMGIREMRSSSEALKKSYFLTIIMLIFRCLLMVMFLLGLNIIGETSRISFVLHIFLSLNIFFWLFKEEDTWASPTGRLLECLVYGIISMIHLMMGIIVMFPPTNNIPIIPWIVIVDRYEIFMMFRFSHYTLLAFILAKRYLVARKNVTGPKHWD